MIRVWVEVSGGATRFRTEVRAESIERAVRLALANHPGCEGRVIFPIDPLVFCEEPVPAAGEIPPQARNPWRGTQRTSIQYWKVDLGREKPMGMAEKGASGAAYCCDLSGGEEVYP